MRLPEGYTVRAASRSDIHAIVGLLNAYDEWEFGESDSHPEQLADDFETPGFHPETDTWLVSSADGQLVAFALYKPGEVGREGAVGFGRVHPSHHGSGLGSFLVDAVDRRWAEQVEDRAGVLLHWLNPNDPAAAMLLDSRGYALVRREYHLERQLVGLPAISLPEGIQLRCFERGRERDLHLVETEAFSEHWGYRAVPFDEWASFLALPSFDPELTLLADDGDQPAGSVWAMVQEDGGWVNVLGVRPPWRGRGIGRALLVAGFAELERRGCTTAKLAVDAGNESGALRLYESVGMTVRREWLVYEKRSAAG